MKESAKRKESGETITDEPANASRTESIKPHQSSEVIGNAFDFRAFGKDTLIYATGQGLLLFFSFIQLLIIPKHLSVEGYGYWQLFMLYASYVGILHLGFIDGILVRWAGKELAQVGSEIKIAFRFLLLEQLIVIIPFALLLYFLLQPPFQWIGLMLLAYAFSMNLTAFFIFTAQAIRKFKLLTAVNVGGGAIFLLFIIFLFALGYLDYNRLIFAFLIVSFVTLFVFAFWFRKYLWGKMPSIPSLLAYSRGNINIGIFVLLGNFVLVFFITIDRLMVSSFFPIDRFAIYAFAMTVAMIVYAFIKAVSLVFFPYLSASETAARTKTYHLATPAIILSWAAILAIYFPITKLVEFYLPHYVTSLSIMQILLCTVGFGSLIQILHVNYYKAYRKQRQYFLWGVMSLALSVILNLLAIKTWGTLESIAIATLISFGVWYIINELRLRSVVEGSSKKLLKSLLIIGSYLGAFWLASFLVDWYIAQMLIYLSFFSLITWLLLASRVKQLIRVANGLLKWPN